LQAKWFGGNPSELTEARMFDYHAATCLRKEFALDKKFKRENLCEWTWLL